MVQFKLEFVPLEEDLLSLEMDDVARDLYLVRNSHRRSADADPAARRRYPNILLLAGTHDVPKSLRPVSAHTGKR